jgi:integrase
MPYLTDAKCRTAKPSTKPRKLFDERGLFLLITPTGSKIWRFRFRFDGKEKLISFGRYPDVPLKLARERRDDALQLLARDINPSEHRKSIKAARALSNSSSFEKVAREWFAKQCPGWSETHARTVIQRLERDVFPWIGNVPVGEVTAPILLERVLRRIEGRGAIETAHRVLGICGQVCRYAVSTGRAERDPSGDLRGALPPVKPEHFASVTKPEDIGTLLRALDSYKGTLPVSCALKLAPLVFVRPGELRQAKWADIDLEQAEWRFTVSKTETEHVVPLSRQAVEILKGLQPLTGRGVYVFPSARSTTRPMSDNAILSAMRRMEIPKDMMTGHGFRAMARTVLDEVLGFRPDFIEHQLAHAVRDPQGRAYNRTAHLQGRRAMMQSWADYLDQLKTGSNVVGIKEHYAAMN